MKNDAEQARLSQPKWLTIFRVILGLILFWKGFLFIQNSAQLEELVEHSRLFDKSSHLVAFLIPWVHLLGGLFICTGLFTRWAALAQLPILIGAVFFVNATGGMHISNPELILSIAVLILVLVFIVKGSGVISADEYFRSYYKAGTEKGTTEKLFN
jgi:putative oxidoreductase